MTSIRRTALLGCAALVGLIGAGAARISGADPLDTAFRFATAIEVDPNDQAMAQERVVGDLIDRGRLDDASRQAAKIKGWRQGTALADVARAWAESGRKDRAREYVDRADAVRRVTADWGAPRIAAHMAEALAAIGDLERSTSLAQGLAQEDAREYGGRAVAAVASGLAQTGDFKSAMARLSALDGERDFDIVWWRTSGYLDLARRPNLPEDERGQALKAARRSADGVSGWKRGEALTSIGREHALHKEIPTAGQALGAAEQIIAPLSPTIPSKASLMSDLAAAWGVAGDRPRALSLLKRAEKEVPEAAVIDRPAALAAIAGARESIGDRDQARALYDRSLSEAASLVNARPRALAVVDICRSLARSGVGVTPPLQARLESLYAGLRDPW
jgi:tetratricopeptide (TPR) repeat protein